jgi:hypothetical protein
MNSALSYNGKVGHQEKEELAVKYALDFSTILAP